MIATPPKGYSATQVSLHWLVFALVAFLFFTGDNTTHVYFAALKGEAPGADWYWMPLHLAVGVAILAAMLWRLAIRLRRGVPPPPAAEAPPLRWLAHAVHVGLYLDMIGAALVGLIVYFWAPALAGVHEALARVVLLALVGLHVAGALAHHFYWGDDVLVRIVTPAKE